MQAVPRRLAAGAVVALVVTVVLQLTGRLDGPALAGGNALGETALVAAGTIVLTWLAVTARGTRQK